MKKMMLALLTILLIASPAAADWSITITWIHSPGTQNHKVFVNNVEQCDVLTTDAASCNFVLPTTANEEVTVVAYDVHGQPSDALTVGNLNAPTKPATPTGGAILYQWQ